MADIHPILRDYLTATTYRRIELAGRKWEAARAANGIVASSQDPPATLSSSPDSRRIVPAMARRLMTPLSLDRGDRLHPIDQLSGPEKLSLVLRYAALPVRWETGSDMIEHRGVPSAGALYPLEITLLGSADGAGSRPRMRCSAPDLSLLEENEAEPGIWAGPIEIAIVARLRRCAEDYGDLALCVAALEAGMCVAQLRILLWIVGWGSEARPPEWSATAELGLTHWSDMVLALLATTLPPDAVDGLPLQRIETEVEATRYDSAERHPRLRAVAQLIAESDAGPERWESGRPFSAGVARGLPCRNPRALLHAMATRSSGRAEDGGWPSSAATFDRLNLLLADVLGLIETSCRGSVADEAVIALIHRRGPLHPPEFLRFDPISGMLAPLADTKPAQRAAGGMGGQDQMLLVTIGLDEVALLQALGPGGLIACYTAAGAIGQCFCVAAALHGLVARPLKSYQDRESDLLLPVRARTFLQIRIGFRGPPNIAFPAI